MPNRWVSGSKFRCGTSGEACLKVNMKMSGSPSINLGMIQSRLKVQDPDWQSLTVSSKFMGGHAVSQAMAAQAAPLSFVSLCTHRISHRILIKMMGYIL